MIEHRFHHRDREHRLDVQIKIDMNREGKMRTILSQEIVPTARQSPGFDRRHR
jgi:hypothetical protein